MNLPYSEKVNIAGLSRLFDQKSECYKLFWFKAVLNGVCGGKSVFTFGELIDEMISEAWYMVTEYHLNLGPKDTLENAVKHIYAGTGMLPSVKKEKIKELLCRYDDPKVYDFKNTLALEVPFRLQAPFIEGDRAFIFSHGSAKRAELINEQKRAMYYYSSSPGLKRQIQMSPEWTEYIVENQEILRGWVEYNLIKYLQRRNPNVPGISDKLSPPQERNLIRVKKFWNMVSELTELHEIYNGVLIAKGRMSIDHFVPWSYVAHDELWNLHPTTRNLNSSKGNRLPDWELYFPKLAALEYKSYQTMWKYEKVHDEFRQCAKEHLNNPELSNRLYKDGLSEKEFYERLSEAVYPPYESAKTCGFSIWNPERPCK